jgi:hypothetical protein
MLFVAKLTGSYALEVKVIRAEYLTEVWALVGPSLCEPFTSCEIIPLESEGPKADLFSERYIE